MNSTPTLFSDSEQDSAETCSPELFGDEPDSSPDITSAQPTRESSSDEVGCPDGEILKLLEEFSDDGTKEEHQKQLETSPAKVQIRVVDDQPSSSASRPPKIFPEGTIDNQWRKRQRNTNSEEEEIAAPCHVCLRYFKECGLGEEEMKKQIKNVCRHKTKGKKRATPPGFWDMDFTTTMPPTQPATPPKRKNKYMKR